MSLECFQISGRKARKQHQCEECSAPIEKGETYSLSSGKWDGDWEEFKQHELCRELQGEIAMAATYPDEVCYGNLWDWSDFWERGDERSKKFRDLVAKIKNRARHFKPARPACTW